MEREREMRWDLHANQAMETKTSQGLSPGCTQMTGDRCVCVCSHCEERSSNASDESVCVSHTVLYCSFRHVKNNALK